MSFYERVSALSGGARALASARLRRAVLAAIHSAFLRSSIESQADLAKRLKVRRSAVNQVFRGDGNVRVNTLAEYLFEMGYEVDIILVEAGEMRRAALEERTPTPALTTTAATTTSASISATYAWQEMEFLNGFWNAIARAQTTIVVVLDGLDESYAREFAMSVYDRIDLSDALAEKGGVS